MVHVIRVSQKLKGLPQFHFSHIPISILLFLIRNIENNHNCECSHSFGNQFIPIDLSISNRKRCIQGTETVFQENYIV